MIDKDRSHREEVKKNEFVTKIPKGQVEISDSVGPDGKPVKKNSFLCVAKYLETKGRQTRFYIKRQTAGGSGFFNPLDDEINALNSCHTITGRGRFEFSLVNQDAYNSYVKFLQTRNAAHLRAAERAV